MNGFEQLEDCDGFATFNRDVLEIVGDSLKPKVVTSTNTFASFSILNLVTLASTPDAKHQKLPT